MKKILLSLSLFVTGILCMQAQCTITPGCSTASGYCSTPAAGTALPNGTELQAYSTTIQVSLGTSFSGATINNGTVTSVSGLPSGLIYSTNPSNGVINGGASGCILISGTPASGTAGSYTVTANVTANTSLGTFPATLTWTLLINSTTGIIDVSAISSNLSIVPNPAQSEIKLKTDFNFHSIRIVDAIGKVHFTQDAVITNQATIDISQMNAGVYFLQISDGTKTYTRKVIKN